MRRQDDSHHKFIGDSGVGAISFVALERNEWEQLEMMGACVLAALAPDLLGAVHFESFEKVFEFVAPRSAAGRIVVLIDGYPHLARECRYMNSLVQRFVDHEWRDIELYLILCGSHVSFMRQTVLGEGAPLHGRSTLELNLRPMGHLESADFVPRYSHEDQAIVYDLTGGVPKYLEQFDDGASIDEIIESQFFASTGYFTDEQIQALLYCRQVEPCRI